MATHIRRYVFLHCGSICFLFFNCCSNDENRWLIVHVSDRNDVTLCVVNPFLELRRNVQDVLALHLHVHVCRNSEYIEPLVHFGHVYCCFLSVLITNIFSKYSAFSFLHTINDSLNRSVEEEIF